MLGLEGLELGFEMMLLLVGEMVVLHSVAAEIVSMLWLSPSEEQVQS